MGPKQRIYFHIFLRNDKTTPAVKVRVPKDNRNTLNIRQAWENPIAMAVMGLLAPLAGMIKVRYGDKADIDSPFFKVGHNISHNFSDG